MKKRKKKPRKRRFKNPYQYWLEVRRWGKGFRWKKSAKKQKEMMLRDE